MNAQIISQRDCYQSFFKIFKDSLQFLPSNTNAYYIWAEPLTDLPTKLETLDYSSSYVVLYIPDDLTDRVFNPYKDTMSWGARILANVMCQHPNTKFVLVTDVINLSAELKLPNLVAIIESEFLVTLQSLEYPKINAVTDKNFNSNVAYLMLNGRAAASRIVLLSYLLDLSFNTTGLITISDHFIEQTKLYKNFLDIINWEFTVQQQEKIIPAISRGYASIQEMQPTPWRNDGCHLDPAENFTKSLRNLYQQTFVEIVVETYYEEPSYMVTEKTMHSIIGCNFPIFISSAGFVAHLESLGFDVFRDIIDHSYDSITDPVDRLVTAIDGNLRLLTDVAYAKQQWKTHCQRLIDNANFAQTQLCNNVYKRAIGQFKSLFCD